jgi:hypothetical protein
MQVVPQDCSRIRLCLIQARFLDEYRARRESVAGVDRAITLLWPRRIAAKAKEQLQWASSG